MTLRKEAACFYGLAALFAVVWFEARLGSLSGTALMLIPYTFVVLVTVVCGYYSGDSYLNRTHSKIHNLGIVFIPVRIFICTSFLTAILFVLVGAVASKILEDSLDFAEIVGGSIAALVVFCHFAWPGLLIGLLGASLALAARQGAYQRDSAL
jgi:hypothetical protein